MHSCGTFSEYIPVRVPCERTTDCRQLKLSGRRLKSSLSTKIKIPSFDEIHILVAGAGLEPATSWL